MISTLKDLKRAAPRDGREVKGAAMRARIRDATEQLISEVGVARTTAVAVAQRCGISRGAVVHHYPTRNDLIIDTARHFYLRVHKVFRSLADDMSEGKTSVERFVEELYQQIFPSRSLLIMLDLMLSGRSEPKIGREVDEFLIDLFHSYEGLGEMAFLGKGMSEQKVHALTYLVFCTLRGLGFQQLTAPDDKVADSVRAALVLAIQGLIPNDEWEVSSEECQSPQESLFERRQA